MRKCEVMEGEVLTGEGYEGIKRAVKPYIKNFNLPHKIPNCISHCKFFDILFLFDLKTLRYAMCDVSHQIFGI